MLRSNVTVTLPSGPEHVLTRPRWEGVLNAEELRWCRNHGVALGYDPVQIGWVPLSVAEHDSVEVAKTISFSPACSETCDTLRFRRWRPEDAPTFAALLDEPEVRRYLPETFPSPLTEAIAADLIAVSSIEVHHMVRAVEHRGVPIGQVRLLFGRQGADRRHAEISYWFGRATWGRGLGSAAVAAATEDAFRTHDVLNLINAWVHPNNHASDRVLQKAGYCRTREIREDGWLGLSRSRK